MFIRRLCCVIPILMLFFGTASAAPMLQDPIYGPQAILYCVESGQTLYEKNADTPVRPASVTKLMTALIVLEQIDDLSQTTTVSNTAVQVESDSTRIGLIAGEVVTLRDMLYATLMHSANDAANVLAEAVAGSQAAFAQMMNVRAAELGCTGSHFENAHGLDAPTHLITARDLVRITVALLEHPRFLEIAGAQSYTMPATNKQPASRTFYTKQRMLRKDSEFYYPYAIAGKNGYTSKAHHTQCMVARKDGMTLIAVSLGASGNRYDTWRDMRTLFHYGFGNFHSVILSSAQMVQIAANSGADVSDCAPVSVILPVGTTIQMLSLSASANENGLRTLQITQDSMTYPLRIMPYPLSCDMEQEAESSSPAYQNLFLFPFVAGALIAARFLMTCIAQQQYIYKNRVRPKHRARRKSRRMRS